MSSLCSNPVGTFDILLCDEYYSGGGDALAIVDCGTTITDPSDPNQWNTDISSNLVEIIKGQGVRFEIGTPTEVTTENPNPCGPPNILIGYDWTFTAEIFNVGQLNNTFMETLGGKTTYMAYRSCTSGKIEWIDQEITWSAPPASFPKANSEYRMYTITGTARFEVDRHPIEYDEPSGIFTVG